MGQDGNRRRSFNLDALEPAWGFPRRAGRGRTLIGVKGTLPFRSFAAAGIAATLGAACGCGQSGGTVDTRGLDAAEKRVAPRGTAGSSAAVVAVIGNNPVTWDDLRPFLGEAAGGEVLEELAAVWLLRARLAAMGEAVSREDILAEQRRIVGAMRASAGADEATVDELALRFRRARRLGPERYALLLERNAMLAKLNASSAALSNEEREIARAIRFGPRYRVRLLLLPTFQEISSARERIAASHEVGEAIAREALNSALNAELAPGGDVEPISPYDDQYPGALRSILARLAPGDLSPVIGLDGSYGLLVVREIIAGNAAPTGDELAQAEQDAREFKLRRLNQLTLRELLEGQGVGVLDPSLRWSWEARRAEGR